MTERGWGAEAWRRVAMLWSSSLATTALRLAPTILVVATLIISRGAADPERLPLPLVLLLAAMVVASNVLILRYGEKSPVRTAALLVFVVAGSVLWYALPESVLAVLPFWAVRAAVRYHLPGRAEVLVVVLGILGASVPLLLVTGSVSSAIGIAVGVIAILLASINRRAREEQLDELQVSLARKQAAIEEHSRAAALAERARIARDVHDVLAHSLAGLSLNLQGARLMLVRDGASEEAIEQVTKAQGLAAEGLSEARRAVATLREDSVPDARAMADLVTAYRLESGAEATFEVTGVSRDLPSEAMAALYRALQEALTNTRKYAPGAPVDVVLRFEDARTALTVEDHPGKPPAHVVGGGYGLLGMRERAELIGGSLEVGPTEDGWRVRLVIPG
ncbi:histidine kinase [Streptomyces sp. SID13031]|uniref:sensor histidine kinase n=1 Tax=Streptomyces sp. SID13031 TaxID=2706046 RepID=UPI0013C65FC3|nr:histidine kinase [Streptomyces sp. SID13031]NEA31384.1 sensor histidine kinase [Streptomyces sp. SID13031]